MSTHACIFVGRECPNPQSCGGHETGQGSCARDLECRGKNAVAIFCDENGGHVHFCGSCAIARRTAIEQRDAECNGISATAFPIIVVGDGN